MSRAKGGSILLLAWKMTELQRSRVHQEDCTIICALLMKLKSYGWRMNWDKRKSIEFICWVFNSNKLTIVIVKWAKLLQ
ncbi:hypothetical protein KY285_002962 [Solanum tuberosum]|nr:hypothetical protein KY285_002962 [Solanum tuberosum]